MYKSLHFVHSITFITNGNYVHQWNEQNEVICTYLTSLNFSYCHKEIVGNGPHTTKISYFKNKQ